MLTSIVYFYILLFFMTRIVLGQLDGCCTPPLDPDFEKGVNLIYYKCNNENPATITYPITASEGLLKVLKDKRTIIYIFGYLQYPEHPVVQLMTNALCERKDDNVVILDWSKYSGARENSTIDRLKIMKFYQNSEKIGRLLVECMKTLVKNGLKEDSIYLIGFSLGAHIAGFPGKCSKVNISRITGLDPANPAFYLPICRLKRNDAQWVDVIHTDMSGYGTPSIRTMATAEFFVNKGTRYQPNCPFTINLFTPDDFCSHRRAVELFAESIRNPNKYIATECHDPLSYNLNLWKGNSTSVFGYSSNTTKGTFCLKTD